jgi:ferredoxin
MKIKIDREACIGAGACVVVAPDVFQIDEENKVVLVDAKGADDDTIKESAEACPTDAIILIDEKSGEQIYP